MALLYSPSWVMGFELLLEGLLQYYLYRGKPVSLGTFWQADDLENRPCLSELIDLGLLDSFQDRDLEPNRRYKGVSEYTVDKLLNGVLLTILILSLLGAEGRTAPMNCFWIYLLSRGISMVFFGLMSKPFSWIHIIVCLMYRIFTYPTVITPVNGRPLSNNHGLFN